MKITDVRLRSLKREGKMRAIVSVTFNEQFVIHDLRIIEGKKGLFVAMPSKRKPSGRFRDIAHPVTPETRTYCSGNYPEILRAGDSKTKLTVLAILD